MIEMKILPNRSEWLKERGHKIGGSDAACILGLNQWKSNTDLWLEKTGQKKPDDISDKDVVKFGTEAEKHIRSIFSLSYPMYEVLYEENNLWLNSDAPFAHCSMDGWLVEKKTGRNGIWECKTSLITNSQSKEKWNNRIPDNYFCQILHSFIVRTDCDFAKLTALLTWNIEGEEVYQQIRNYHIERKDVQEDIDYLAEKESKFYCENIVKRIKPSLILPTI